MLTQAIPGAVSNPLLTQSAAQDHQNPIQKPRRWLWLKTINPMAEIRWVNTWKRRCCPLLS